MSARKTLNVVIQQLKLLEIIYEDLKLPEDYFEKLNHLRERIYKLPKMAEKKPELLSDEIEWCVSQTKELYEEINPELLLKYRKEYNIKPFGGDIGKI